MAQLQLEDRALALIRSRRVSAHGLASALGVSARTAARAVATLRTRGHRVASIRDGRRWYYVLPGVDTEKDPLLGLVGFTCTKLEDGAVNHDHYLYGFPKKG